MGHSHSQQTAVPFTVEDLYRQYDTNGDGKVSREEVGVFLKNLWSGKLSSDAKESEAALDHMVESFMKKNDADGDGTVTLEEFKAAMEPFKAHANEVHGVFVINGFYAAMRSVYTNASAKIHWFDVEWSSADNSWANFRGQVLGATDPADAAEGSLRRTILQQYEALGLTETPNVGLNGVHASASPFEAYAERLNWLGADAAADTFGAAALGAGVSAETLALWTKDPQVDLKEGKGSLFDQLEDQSVEDCLATMQSLAGVEGTVGEGLKNRAFVFIKPHAVNEAVIKLVQAKFAEAKITIIADGELTGTEIEENKYIDNHYYAIAAKASLNKPNTLNPPAAGLEKFEKKFGLTWEAAQPRMYNAVDACALLGLNGQEMDSVWAAEKKAGRMVKLSGGFYAGLLPRIR
jgi:nucleoside diphosphate kinase